MSSLEKVRNQYVKDADAMAAKPRFGFFSILPSHTAAISAFPQKAISRNEDGRVATQPRNIYSGCTSSGQIKKSYFSYTASAFHGSPFEIEVQERLKASGSKHKEGQEIFRPAKLNKTLMSASYKYLAQKPHERTNLRDADGRVITASRNIYTSLQSKIHSEANKQFKYVAETCQEKKSKAPIQQSSDQPFKIGNHPKEFFSNNIQLFCNLQAAAKKPTEGPKKVGIIHDSPFRPSCTATNKFFNPLDYKQQQENARTPVIKRGKAENIEHMKLGKVEYNSRPCPSVAYSKMNILRVCR